MSMENLKVFQLPLFIIPEKSFVKFENIDKSYDGKLLVVENLNLNIAKGEFLTLLGPSGSGKRATLMMLAGFETPTSGEIYLDGDAISNIPPYKRGIGMVFQKPNPFPKSIYDNVAYGPRLHGIATKKNDLDNIVEESLTKAGLFKEVKDRLNDTAIGLSGGQQQRLCIARTISISPSIILMDEPCSALDPIATAVIEELIENLKKSYTILIVTHNMQQAARVSEKTAFFHLGKLIEFNDTRTIFTNPREKKTLGYITGRYG